MVRKCIRDLSHPISLIIKRLRDVGSLLTTEPIIPLTFFSFFALIWTAGYGSLLFALAFLIFLFISYLLGVKKLATKNSKQNLGGFIVLLFLASITISNIVNMDLPVIFFLSIALISGIIYLLNNLYPKIITDFLFKAILFPILLFLFVFSGLFLIADINAMSVAVLLCFALIQLIDGRKAIWILKLIVLCVLILAVFGFGQAIVGGVHRVYSLYSDPNNYGDILMIGTWVALFHYMKAEEIKKTAFYFICFFFIVTNLLLTLSRGAISGFVFSIGVFALLSLLSKVKITKQSIKKVLAFIVPLLLVSMFFIPKIMERGEGGLETRVFIWTTSFRVFLEKPVFGGGRHYLRNKSTELFQEGNLNLPSEVLFNSAIFNSAHNLYLNLAVELGIVGFFAFSLLMIAVFIQLFKSLSNPNLRPLSICLISMFSGLMIHGLTDVVLWYPPVQLAFFILISLVLEICR